MSQSNQLIVLPETLPAEVRAEIQADLEASAQAQVQKLPLVPQRIQIAPGGGASWRFAEDKQPLAPFKGIILEFSAANAYWHDADRVANPILIDLPDNHNFDIPLCTSTDGVHGNRPQESAAAGGVAKSCFGQCAKCYLNEFGTAVDDKGMRGKGKACKNGVRLLVAVPKYQVPFILTLPPTSLIPFRSYITRLTSANLIYWTVRTFFGLQEKTAGKNAWSVFAPGAPEPLTPEEVTAVYYIRKQFIPAIQTEITEADFATAETEEEPSVI